MFDQSNHSDVKKILYIKTYFLSLLFCCHSLGNVMLDRVAIQAFLDEEWLKANINNIGLERSRTAVSVKLSKYIYIYFDNYKMLFAQGLPVFLNINRSINIDLHCIVHQNHRWQNLIFCLKIIHEELVTQLYNFSADAMTQIRLDRLQFSESTCPWI